jgi:hypothetical protein
VTFAIIVFASTLTKVRMPSGGVVTPDAGAGAPPAADPSSSSVTLRG